MLDDPPRTAPAPAPSHRLAPALAVRDAGLVLLLLGCAAGRGVDAAMRAIAAAAVGAFERFGLVTAPRLAEFLAQCAHETGGFTRFEEDLRYSAARLAAVWPARFAADPQASPRRPNARALALAGRPEAIADAVYARAAEGNNRPGDGWRYRGRGLIQLTFRGNYRRVGRRLGLDLEARPELAADPATGLLVALDFWAAAGVNAHCDRGDWLATRGLTNCGTARPKVVPVGLAEVAVRRERVLAMLS